MFSGGRWQQRQNVAVDCGINAIYPILQVTVQSSGKRESNGQPLGICHNPKARGLSYSTRNREQLYAVGKEV